ncbi:MAG TPA: threonine synthase [Vicinamibacteria bacterium]|nr:threonine synthase [Vicinamibacteria bacterium]
MTGGARGAPGDAREWLACITCGATYGVDEVRTACACGGLLSVERPEGWASRVGPGVFDSRLGSRADVDRSGVWRFREAVRDLPPEALVTHPEGSTRLYARAALSAWAGVDRLLFKHEGENPTGSFKDRGMAAGITQAMRVGARAVACASTGNTSASLAAYAAQVGRPAFVFLPAGKVAVGKVAQTLAYGARGLAVRGDFDAALRLVSESCARLGIYLLNSVNPFRIEGQKTIVWELLQDLGWEPPDWIAVPAGNLGNTSAFGKALREAKEGGWIARVPRLLAVQATGANPFYRSFRDGFRSRHRVTPETIATAIRIGDPVSHDRARAAIEDTRGLVTEVSDDQILEAKARIDGAGLGCEPASAASLAGVRRLRAEGVIAPGERVVCVLTGHLLKDPDAILARSAERALVEVDADPAAVEAAIGRWLD